MEYSKTPILIIGTGAEARVALDIATALDVLVYGFLTEDAEEVHREMNDILVVGEMGGKDAETLLKDENTKLVLAFREGDKRQEVMEELSSKKADIISLVHPSADISPYAQIGNGTLVYPGVVVLANSGVGQYSLLMSGVKIATDVEIGENVTIEQGAIIGANVVIEDECFIGAGAVIQPGLTIGREAMIGAGAVVLMDVPDNATVFGNPAQIVK